MTTGILIVDGHIKQYATTTRTTKELINYLNNFLTGDEQNVNIIIVPYSFPERGD